MSEKIIAVAYARYSSDNQREESIDAQLRAIHKYAEESGITIIHEYIDRAQSGTNANREEFLQMLNDSKNREFDMVIVHKLDRFARNRYDSAFSRKNRDSIEKYVLKMLSDILFNEDRLPKIIEEYNKQIREDSGIEEDKKRLKTVIEDSRKKIRNLTAAIAETGSSALFDALKTEESRLNNMEAELSDLERSSNEVKVDETTIRKAFLQAKSMLESGELPNIKKLINLYVQKITVNYDSIDVQINVLAALKSNSDKQNFTDLDSVSDKAFLLSGNVGRKDLK